MPRPAEGRKVRDAREARELLAAWSKSGVAISAWCEERGINWYSLSAYKGWPGRRREVFVEVETAEAEAPPSSSRYRVVLGARIVEVGDDFDDDVLGRLVRVIEAC